MGGADDLCIVVETLSQVNDIGSDEYLEVDTACNALAAAEVFAALRCNPSSDIPPSVITFVKRIGVTPSEELIKTSLRAIERIRTNSELAELWTEGDGETEWLAILND